MKDKNKKGLRSTDQSDRITPKATVKNRHLYNNTNLDYLSTIEPYCTILNSIGTGEENAVHLSVIIRKTGLHNREVRKCIEHLRRSGAVIIANSKGYFKPETSAELERYINQETHRAKSIFFTLKSAIKYRKRLGE